MIDRSKTIPRKATDRGFSNGFSGNMGEPPAAYALVRMGSLAVPKLSEALRHDDNGYKRVKLVLCLSRIDEPESKLALEKALSTEKDETIRSYILRALR